MSKVQSSVKSPLPSRSMGQTGVNANRSQSKGPTKSIVVMPKGAKGKNLPSKRPTSANQPAKVALAKKASQKKANLQLAAFPAAKPKSLLSLLRTENGKGGTDKGPHVKRTSGQVNTQAMDNRLKKHSPWYASLRDPIQGAGARIPDVVGIETATLQMVQNVTFTTNANGLNGCFLRSPLVSSTTAANPVYPVPSTATTTALTWDTTNNVGLSIAPTMRTVAQGHRVVSAAVYAEYEGSTLNDQGDVTSFIGPWEDLLAGWLTAGAGQVPSQTLAAAQASFGAVTVPVNKARSRPVASMYFPCNMEDQNYDSFWDPVLAAYGFNILADTPCWGIGHIFSGLAAGTSVKYTIVINYEFIPLLNTQDYISCDPSPIDPIEEQLVEQWVVEDSWTGLSSNKKVDVTPGAQVVDSASQGMNADAGFGMLGSILTELIPVAIAAL